MSSHPSLVLLLLDRIVNQLVGLVGDAVILFPFNDVVDYACSWWTWDGWYCILRVISGLKTEVGIKRGEL